MTNILNKEITVGHEPKMNNRFVLEFTKEFGIDSFLVQTISRPKMNLVNGKCIWDNFSITLIDVVEPSTSKLIMNLVNFCKISDGNDELFKFAIKILDPTGVELEKWTVSVKELVGVDFGNSDYKDSGMQIITIVLRPIDCVLE